MKIGWLTIISMTFGCLIMPRPTLAFGESETDLLQKSLANCMQMTAYADRYAGILTAMSEEVPDVSPPAKLTTTPGAYFIARKKVAAVVPTTVKNGVPTWLNRRQKELMISKDEEAIHQSPPVIYQNLDKFRTENLPLEVCPDKLAKAAEVFSANAGEQQDGKLSVTPEMFSLLSALNAASMDHIAARKILALAYEQRAAMPPSELLLELVGGGAEITSGSNKAVLGAFTQRAQRLLLALIGNVLWEEYEIPEQEMFETLIDLSVVLPETRPELLKTKARILLLAGSRSSMGDGYHALKRELSLGNEIAKRLDESDALLARKILYDAAELYQRSTPGEIPTYLYTWLKD